MEGKCVACSFSDRAERAGRKVPSIPGALRDLNREGHNELKRGINRYRRKGPEGLFSRLVRHQEQKNLSPGKLAETAKETLEAGTVKGVGQSASSSDKKEEAFHTSEN